MLFSLPAVIAIIVTIVALQRAKRLRTITIITSTLLLLRSFHHGGFQTN
jgi:hypothetical protein